MVLKTKKLYNYRLINDPSRTEEARRKIFFKAQSLGLNMDGLDNTNAGFLRLFTTAFYAVVPNVESLSITGNYTSLMTNTVDKCIIVKLVF